jgi:hypothetical protein
MSSETFHIHLYGPDDSSDGPSSSRQTAPIPTSFEAAQQRLEKSLPKVLLEPDGSFAWAGNGYQIVGMIYDAATVIQYVELRGHCDQSQLRKLVQTLAGELRIDGFGVMVLPDRQWKIFQSFETSLPSATKNPPSESNN